MMDIIENVDSNFSIEPRPPQLAPELGRYVSAINLKQNAERYPELQRELTPDQVRKVGQIKGQLLQLPLIHGTREPFAPQTDILPTSELPAEHRGHTYGLDKSLGLDKYTFFHWGLPEKSTYGRNFLVVSPSILTSPNTVVTPRDIGTIAYVDDTPFEQLPDEKKKRYQEGYLDKMVTGQQWLEIISRRVLASYESGNPFYNLHSTSSLGEIKHLGSVGHQFIDRQLSDKQFSEYYKFLYEHGFSFDNMERARELYQRTGKKYGVDPLPEECGVDYDQASKYWEQLLSA